MYYSISVPFPLSTRECILCRRKEVLGDRGYVMTRSSTSVLARSIRKNPLRVRMNIHIGGYLMEDLGPASEAGRGNRIKVTYIAGVDLNGVFAVDWVARKVTPHHLKGVVEYLREKAREAAGGWGGGEGEGGRGEGGVKGALDMSSIYEEEGTFEMTNVKARKVPVEKITSPLHEDVG
jgi:hypothetical protein